MDRCFQAVKGAWVLMRDAFREFQLNDPLRMAAATSFFASFALPPILIILIEVFGIFGDQRMIRRDLFQQLGIILDKNVAMQTREILRNLHYMSLSPGLRIGGFIFLLFVASTLFEVIKNSLNQLWKIKLKDQESFGALLLHRAKSIGIILIAGVLLSIAILGGTRVWGLITLLAVIAWFILVLRYLSYGRPAWKTAVAGGVFTGVLFTLGQFLLHLLLSYNHVKTIYGASTSLVLLLLFVFYCSFMFYFGACFTAVLAVRTGRPIALTRHAIRYTLESVELEGE